jgi:hypothetical protein
MLKLTCDGHIDSCARDRYQFLKSYRHSEENGVYFHVSFWMIAYSIMNLLNRHLRLSYIKY